MSGLVWSAHFLGKMGSWGAAEGKLLQLDSLIQRCYLPGLSTLEVRYWGERLKTARNLNDSTTAMLARRTLQLLVERSSRDSSLTSQSCGLNGWFHLGIDNFARESYDTADSCFANCIRISNGRHSSMLEGSYRYVYWVSRILWAGCQSLRRVIIAPMYTSSCLKLLRKL